MSFPDTLLRASYPAVIIDRWTSVTGWDECFRVFLALPGHLISTPGEHATYDAAHVDAVELAATQAPAPCPIFDMTKERG